MTQITVRQYQFDLVDVYQPGHCLDDNEAEALNRLRAENIRNNVKPRVDAAAARLEPGELLSPAALAELQATVARYARDYRFQPATIKKRFGIIEIEARRVARERVEFEARLINSPIDQAWLDETIDKWAKLPEVVEEARLRVAERQRVVSQGIEDLL